MKRSLMISAVAIAASLYGAVPSISNCNVGPLERFLHHFMEPPDSLVVIGNEHRANWACDTLIVSGPVAATRISSPTSQVNALPSVSGTLALTTFSGYSVGTIAVYSGAAVPAGFLKCDGQIISRATYSRLFSVIGTSYDAGNGSTTFGLPDIKHAVLSYAIRFE